MTKKGIAIIVLMVIALLAAIFIPAEFIGLPEGTNVILSKLANFAALSTVFLCWVGAPVGWVFAEDCGFVAWGRIVMAFIFMYLSLPIAIFQLVKSRADYLNQ